MFVRSALAPAEISSVRLDERNKAMEIMVEDDQLSLAIGRRGQNVRLAAHLTGWKLDIISKTKLQKRQQDAIFALQHIESVNETLAQAIYQAGLLTPRHVADASLEVLAKVPGFETEEQALSLKTRAQDAAAKLGDTILAAPESAATIAAGDTPRDAKSLAEERLREMMKKADE